MPKTSEKPLIVITMGDPAGVGPEITAKTMASPEVHGVCRPLIIGDAAVMERISERLRLKRDYRRVSDPQRCTFEEQAPEVLQTGNLPPREIEWGQPQSGTSKAALEYVETAIGLCVSGAVDAMATGPLDKGGIVAGGVEFTGHTELLAKRTGTEEYAMMLTGGDIRVVLATTHIPLSEVAPRIKKERVLTLLRLTHRSMPLFGIHGPRIGVAALNPHGGEKGSMGREELEEIIPAVETACSEGIEALGPYPADTLFLPSKRGNFDVFLVMYHDQGLIPLKTEAFLSAVNVTLGLPIIRTSVGHGTAYDIAGRGEADPLSMINAVKTAAGLATRRGPAR